MEVVNGIQIRGAGLRALRHQRRLSGAALGSQTDRTVTQVYRVENGSPTSLEFLDSLVPLFGVDAVAGLIENDEQRATFLAAHLTNAGSE